MNDAKETYVCKLPAFPEAKDHIRGLEMACQGLQADLAGSGLTVNTCMLETEPDGSIAAHFPFCKGWTLEEKLDTIWKREGEEALIEEIRRYFSMFADTKEPFVETEAFRQVFGTVQFTRPQYSRSISDIDMIFRKRAGDGDGIRADRLRVDLRFSDTGALSSVPLPLLLYAWQCEPGCIGTAKAV